MFFAKLSSLPASKNIMRVGAWPEAIIFWAFPHSFKFSKKNIPDYRCQNITFYQKHDHLDFSSGRKDLS